MKDYKIIWKINEGNENKILLGDFNITLTKWTGMVEIKREDFIDTVPKVQGLH